jgi:hypothetical protein
LTQFFKKGTEDWGNASRLTESMFREKNVVNWSQLSQLLSTSRCYTSTEHPMHSLTRANLEDRISGIHPENGSSTPINEFWKRNGQSDSPSWLRQYHVQYSTQTCLRVAAMRIRQKQRKIWFKFISHLVMRWLVLGVILRSHFSADSSTNWIRKIPL